MISWDIPGQSVASNYYAHTHTHTLLLFTDRHVPPFLLPQRPPPYIPYEFTFEGMLERITAYLKNQQYCRPHQWPPADMLIATISKDGESCKDTCFNQGKVKFIGNRYIHVCVSVM